MFTRITSNDETFEQFTSVMNEAKKQAAVGGRFDYAAFIEAFNETAIGEMISFDRLESFLNSFKSGLKSKGLNEIEDYVVEVLDLSEANEENTATDSEGTTAPTDSVVTFVVRRESSKAGVVPAPAPRKPRKKENKEA